MIRERAAGLFAKKGFTSVTMHDICKHHRNRAGGIGYRFVWYTLVLIMINKKQEDSYESFTNSSCCDYCF